jgi:hypothetical protein
MMATNRQNGASVVFWSSTFFYMLRLLSIIIPLAWKTSAKPAAAKAPAIDVLSVDFPSPIAI